MPHSHTVASLICRLKTHQSFAPGERAPIIGKIRGVAFCIGKEENGGHGGLYRGRRSKGPV